MTSMQSTCETLRNTLQILRTEALAVRQVVLMPEELNSRLEQLLQRATVSGAMLTHLMSAQPGTPGTSDSPIGTPDSVSQGLLEEAHQLLAATCADLREAEQDAQRVYNDLVVCVEENALSWRGHVAYSAANTSYATTISNWDLREEHS